MRRPPFLCDGGKIGFIAPSFGAATEPYITRFNSALWKFHNMGYRTVEGPNARLCAGVGKSNSAMECGIEINSFMTENYSDVVISVGGGETMCEDLPYVNFDKISSSDPKWFLGYSDNTNLSFLLATICDTMAIYGPNACDFGMEPWHKSIEDVFNLLRGRQNSFSNYDGWEKSDCDSDSKTAPYNITEPYKQIVFPSGKVSFEGRFIGGCLDTLVTLAGTRFDVVKEFNRRYENDGIVWFLEACELGAMSVRRALWQLDNAGWFQNVKGFIIGRSLNYEDRFGDYSPLMAYRDFLKTFNVPIIMDTDLGHLSPMMPFVMGGYGMVEASGNEINITYDLQSGRV